MAVYYDQLKREVSLATTPKRIISVVPSQTELLFYLGLSKEIIGITKFCIRPASAFRKTTKIGGTKQLNIQLIRELKPDLIIANKEENDRIQIEELTTICPVWISDIKNLDEAIEMIINVGKLVARAAEARTLADTIIQRFDTFITKPLTLRVAYLIWRKPYMVAGKQTFIDSLLERCGLTNVFNESRYPEVSGGELLEKRPDVILLSSEPYPFKQKHIDEFKLLLPDARILLVDGELFSWYGSRLLHAPAYFMQLIEKLTSN